MKKDQTSGSTYDKLYWFGLNGEVLQESALNGTLQDEYIFLNGQRTARRTSGGTVYYFFSDHLGSTRVVTNATGGIVEESDYYPFGGERVLTDTLNNNYKFTGQERDAESALDNFTARHYASNLGRFLQPDEFTGGPVDAFSANDPAPPGPLPYALITNPQSLNKYTYTWNNPLVYVDPEGRSPATGVMVETLLSVGSTSVSAAVAATVGVAGVVLGAKFLSDRTADVLVENARGREQLAATEALIAVENANAISSLTFAKDAQAGQLQQGADKAAEAAKDALGKLTQAEAGRQLTQEQQAK
ncbi:MAG: RHS repeat-associated core domain-containing protein, partial [Candidatus Acidiferrales bacterium]